MNKIFAGLAVLLVALLLIGSFVVYPAVAAGTAKDEVTSGINEIASSSDLKFNGLTVTVEGGNAFNRVFKGEDVGDIDIRIDSIEIPEGAAQGNAPQIKSEQQAEASARELLDQFERVGTVTLTIGKIASGPDSVNLNDSSVSVSDGEYGLTLNVAKSDVNELLKQFGASLKADASGNRVKASLAVDDAPEMSQDFEFAVTPKNNGRDIELEFNGEKTLEKGKPGDPTLTKVEFGSEGDFYSISVAGTFDWDRARAELEKDLD